MHKYIIENENDIFSRIENTHAYKSSEYVRNRISKFIEYLKLVPEQKKVVNVRACEKKSVNSVFYDYIFTYPALCIPE